MPANAVVNLAVGAAILKSASIASDNPAPAATPLTAAMTGFGICASVVAIGL